MKKLLALLLAMALLLSLAACGSSNDDDDDDDDRTSSSSKNDKNDKNEEEVEIGTVKNNIYKNEFADIKCTLGSEWTFLTEEEIEENNRTTYGLLSNDFAEAIKEADVFVAMMAKHSNQTSTVNLVFEKLKASVASYTEEQYAEASKAATKSALEQIGLSNVTLTVGEGTFLGEDHVIIDISAKYQGMAMYEKMALVKCGEYMILITACTWETNDCQDILDCFKAL